jgi:hypothetical protein
MFCSQCNEKIEGKAVKQGNELYCSLECANLASGVEPEETEDYFDEDGAEEFYEDDDK